MISFTTDDVPAQHRFEEWREVRGKSQFGVTIELVPERRLAFQGWFRAHTVGGAVASEMRASAYRVSRTEADIACLAGDRLCIGYQIKGSGMLDTGGDRLHAVRAGDMTISHSDLPYAGTPHANEDFHFRMLTIPVEAETVLGRPIHDLVAARYAGESLFSRAFRALFNALSAPQSNLVDPDRDVVHITRLALVARGRVAPGMPEVRASLRSGLCYAALEVMARDKHRKATSPALVASELGISVRQLHIIFEGAELSFSRTLAAMRMKEAERLLITNPALPVTQVAYACGFDSLATFYRLFDNAFGMAPGQIRKTALSG